MSKHCIYKSFALGLLVLGLPAPLHACGPYLPHRILVEDEQSFLELPYSTFMYEAKRVPPPFVPPFKAVLPPSNVSDPRADHARHTEQVDLEELGKALEVTALDPSQRQQIIEAYRTVRQELTLHAEAVSFRKDGFMLNKKDSQEPLLTSKLQIPDNLPGEFADYLRGAIAYHQQEAEQARQAWLALLERSAAERHYRSTWAAYMIGRSLVESNPQEACKRFKQVRDLASEGYADGLGLAATSLGWEAGIEMKQGHFARALELFRAQLETGEPSAEDSLLFAARHAATAATPEARAECVRSMTARRLITAYLVSASNLKGDMRIPLWLNSFKGVDFPLEEAERLAWAAYQSGQVDLCRALLEKAPGSSPIAQWLRAKLLLREGKIDEALPLIADVAAHFPRDDNFRIRRDNFSKELFDDRRALAEIGGLRLARSEFITALDALVQSSGVIEYTEGRYWDDSKTERERYWEDAAYVAEQVFTLQELKEFVDQRWPNPSPNSFDSKKVNPGDRMRYILARRLAREGRQEEAIPYVPARWRESMLSYVEHLQHGKDTQLPDQQRGDALWAAAKIARSHGMELLGTEVDPDWTDLDGAFDLGNMTNDRPRTGSIKASSEELERAGRNRPQPDRRFHYRFVAANHGWEASRLLPDNSDQTALVLATAGTWIKNIDTKGADRFYKALVQRCGKTELGKKALELHWFPPLPATGDSEPAKEESTVKP